MMPESTEQQKLEVKIIIIEAQLRGCARREKIYARETAQNSKLPRMKRKIGINLAERTENSNRQSLLEKSLDKTKKKLKKLE